MKVAIEKCKKFEKFENGRLMSGIDFHALFASANTLKRFADVLGTVEISNLEMDIFGKIDTFFICSTTGSSLGQNGAKNIVFCVLLVI